MVENYISVRAATVHLVQSEPYFEGRPNECNEDTRDKEISVEEEFYRMEGIVVEQVYSHKIRQHRYENRTCGQ